MLGSKGILTPLIPNCYVLCTLAILKTFVIRSFFFKKWLLTHVWRVPSSKILLQASLRRISDLLPLVSQSIEYRNYLLCFIFLATPYPKVLPGASSHCRPPQRYWSGLPPPPVLILPAGAGYNAVLLNRSFW